MKKLLLILVFILLCGTSYSQTVHKKVDLHAYDTNFWNIALVWHGDLTVHQFAVLLKAHAMQESGMRPNAKREEKGYLSGKYAVGVAKTAKQIQKYLQQEYGIYESLFTIETDLSRSFSLIQIMGQRAWELGFRGADFYDEDQGLYNVDTGLYYGAKLMNINLKRYLNDMTKAISAYNAGSFTKSNSGYVKNVIGFMDNFIHDFDSYKEP